MTTIFILWDCDIYLWAWFWTRRIDSVRSNQFGTLKSIRYAQFGSIRTERFETLNSIRIDLINALRFDHNGSFHSNSMSEFNTLHSKCPFFLTDLSNVKQWIFISSLLLIIYWMTIFSFFPTMMFLLKFIFLFLFINHSLGWAFSLVIFLVFIFQGFYIRSIGMILLSLLLPHFTFFL